LKTLTVVVADTGDFAQIAKYQPVDSTTNPTLLLQASQQAQYAHLVEGAVVYARQHAHDVKDRLALAVDKLAVNFGVEILKLVPGRVSTEIDSPLSFDADATVERAHRIVELYKEVGISSDRILLKIAATWEGLQAAKRLEAEGLHVNVTLLFAVVQAAAAGEANATLISPFCARISDYFKEKNKRSYDAPEDPGVLSVKQIYAYMKQYGYKTSVMGASFRNKEQVLELAGCDLLTVSPAILDDIQNTHTEVPTRITFGAQPITEKLKVDEKTFRRLLNDDEMAEFKLAEGIRRFNADLQKLETYLRAKLE